MAGVERVGSCMCVCVGLGREPGPRGPAARSDGGGVGGDGIVREDGGEEGIAEGEGEGEEKVVSDWSVQAALVGGFCVGVGVGVLLRGLMSDARGR